MKVFYERTPAWEGTGRIAVGDGSLDALVPALAEHGVLVDPEMQTVREHRCEKMKDALEFPTIRGAELS